MSHVCVTIVGPSAVILVLSYNYISHASSMCSSSSIVRTPPGTVEPSVYPLVFLLYPSTYAWDSIIQPTSVVTHIRVRTGDHRPWSVYASWLMLSCRYASFYVYLLSIFSSDASLIVTKESLIGVRVRSWPNCLNPRGFCRLAYSSVVLHPGVLPWSGILSGLCIH
jgi:hypothetical protein